MGKELQINNDKSMVKVSSSLEEKPIKEIIEQFLEGIGDRGYTFYKVDPYSFYTCGKVLDIERSELSFYIVLLVLRNRVTISFYYEGDIECFSNVLDADEVLRFVDQKEQDVKEIFDFNCSKTEEVESA